MKKRISIEQKKAVEQKYKLQKAIELITDSINHFEDESMLYVSVWLSVAGDYCKEVAKEMEENEQWRRKKKCGKWK